MTQLLFNPQSSAVYDELRPPDLTEYCVSAAGGGCVTVRHFRARVALVQKVRRYPQCWMLAVITWVINSSYNRLSANAAYLVRVT